MSEYVPTKEYACEKYVQAMRQAFVASAGEHREEFDRMIAEVERAAAAKALEGAADAMNHAQYRVAAFATPMRWHYQLWLRARAEAYREGKSA